MLTQLLSLPSSQFYFFQPDLAIVIRYQDIFSDEIKCKMIKNAPQENYTYCRNKTFSVKTLSLLPRI